MLYLVSRLLLRLIIIIMLFGCFEKSQHFISNIKRANSSSISNSHVIFDKTFEWTEGINHYLRDNKLAADVTITAVNFVIDILFVLIILEALLNNIKIISGYFIILFLRQISQYIVDLPIPTEILWYNPHIIPSITADYDISSDFFFSGHTATTIYISFILCRTYLSGFFWRIILPTEVVLFTIIVLISLRAHYYMDIYAGMMTSILALLTYYSIKFPSFMEYQIITAIYEKTPEAYQKYLRLFKKNV